MTLHTDFNRRMVHPMNDRDNDKPKIHCASPVGGRFSREVFGDDIAIATPTEDREMLAEIDRVLGTDAEPDDKDDD